MADSGFRSFCDGQFWNSTLIAENTWPQFTDCFQATVLVWVPCGFLFLFLPCYITSVDAEKKAGPVPITIVNALRLFCCITLTLLTLVQLLMRADDGAVSHSVAAFLGDALRLATYVLMALMTQYERLKGAQSVSVPFYFWVISLICHTIPVYTVIIQQLFAVDLVSFVCLLLTYILHCLSLLLTCCQHRDHSCHFSTPGHGPCPETTCSYPSYLLFYWMNRLMVTGYRRDVEEEDLWQLPRSEQTRQLVPRMQDLWQREHQRCHRVNSQRQVKKESSVSCTPSLHNGYDVRLVKSMTEKTLLIGTVKENKRKEASPSLLRVIVQMNAPFFALCFVQKVASDLILLCSPLALGVLMTLLQQRPQGREWQAYVMCAAMFLVIILKSILFAHSMFGSTRIGIRIKSTLIAAIYEKALTMNNAAKARSTVGEVVNLMSVDAQRILDMMAIFFYASTTPIQTIVAILLLYLTIGPSIFAGLLLLLLLIPFNFYIVHRQRSLQSSNLKFKDARVRLYNEILNGIKVLKLYAWEPSFREKIREIRLKEIGVLFKLAVLNMLMSLCWDMAPYLVTLVTFATYLLSDPNNYLDPQKAFISLSLFNILRAPLNLLSTTVMYLVQAQVSIRRVNDFLKSEDLDPTAVEHDSSAKNVISIQDGTFTWDRSISPNLRNINLTVEEGRLVAVVGPVGCGKSSLINAMLGELERVKGKVVSRGSVSFVPQQAWIQNATLRDNILFGKAYNQRKYSRVLRKCQLERDLTILSAGDMTEIGEKGINLSGGQKQRVSLARAVYSDRDIYLLDDPLSAVDSHVGKAIFREVIGNTGALKGKTRVLVTHGVHWLPMVDEIVVMLDGTVTERGSFEELVSHDGPFAQFLKVYLTEYSDSEGEDDPELAALRSGMAKRLDSLTSEGHTSTDDVTDLDSSYRKRRRKGSRRSEGELSESERMEDGRASIGSSSRRRRSGRSALEESLLQTPTLVGGCPDLEVPAGQTCGRLTTIETLDKGKVNRQVFKDYGQAAGLLPLGGAFLSFCVFQALSVGANFWLNQWSGDPRLLNASLTGDVKRLRTGNDSYLAIYGVLGIFQLLFLVCFNYLFWNRMVVAARKLHQRLADRLLRAPMSFYDTTPVGRILNRVSRDVETVDNMLPLIVHDWLVTFALVLVTLVVIVVQTPLAAAILLPLVVVYYFLQNFYVPTARQLKRIESVSRTPIYSLFSETMSGTASIRAYGATQRFLEECKSRVDRNQVSYFASQGAVRWLQFNLDILAATVVFAAGVFALLSDRSDSGDAGLSVSYALQVSGTLTWMTRQICEFETNIVSVERLKEYSELNTEADWIRPKQRPPAGWPHAGEVTFDNFQTRYREGLELVLKGVTCTIRDGEKVGIVGRTGAGKSSLTLSLFRLIEAAGGAICIDGINIGDLGLHDLRSRLTILPQDPVLFSGTLRMNLDPFSEFEDGQLWTALERAHLRRAVDALPGQLDYQCGEEGSNLSVGQRQLVCLARTLLRRTKILVLDEATAAVDMETDALIQNTIRTAFGHCTVITIAHRLNTIMDYDRIMVMEGGRIQEFAPPQHLLADRRSAFYAMARDAGLV